MILRLQENRIGGIDEDAFKNLKELKYLHLSNNELNLLPAGLLAALESVENLDFSNNNINSVETGTFSGLSHLEFLSLSFNKIEHLPDDMVDSAMKNVEINVRSNKLRTVSRKPFAKIPRPMYLDISGNPLNCDSSLCWLKQEATAGCVKWVEEKVGISGLPVGHLYKPNCAYGTNWDDINWDCEEDVELDCDGGMTLNQSSLIFN